VTWGPGMAFNPTDLLNPAKDPTDPSFQRAGAWMARVEVPLESSAFTVLFAPLPTRQEHGIPSRFLYYPPWDSAGDDQAHFLIAARAYALVAESDLNFMLFYSDRYRDGLASSVRAGASFSRYFFNALELHAEGLFFGGSSRVYPTHECLQAQAQAEAIRCVIGGTPLFEARREDGSGLTARVLLGTRYQLDDDTMLSAEYLFQSDGYTRADLQSMVNALLLVREARRLGLDPSRIGMGGPFGGGAQDGSPQKFRFEPLGRHHLFLTFQKNRIREDFSVSAVVIASLQDLSAMVAPTVAWQATEWLTVSLAGFVPFSGPASLSAAIPESDETVGEYGLAPMEYRAILELRAFY
jgi:hypothetical protein